MTHFYKKSTHYYDNSDIIKSEYVPVRTEDDDESSEHNVNESRDNYIRQLLGEKLLIDKKDCPNAYKYICEEIQKVKENIVKGPQRDNRYLDLYNDIPTKITAKVLIPVKEFPRYNFIGKILGPKGSTLKELQKNTQCYMNIGGRGSMRDPEKEEALRKSLEPKYAHLSDELHIDITAIAKPRNAHARVANGLNEIYKYLIPIYATPETEESDLSYKKSIFGKVTFSGERMDHEERIPKGPTDRPAVKSDSTVMSILNKARVSMQETHKLEVRRRPPKEFDHEEEPDRGYQPKRRYEEKGSYGKYTNDALYKRRKPEEQFN